MEHVSLEPRQVRVVKWIHIIVIGKDSTVTVEKLLVIIIIIIITINYDHNNSNDDDSDNNNNNRSHLFLEDIRNKVSQVKIITVQLRT